MDYVKLLCGAALAFIIGLWWGRFDHDNDGESNMSEYLSSLDADNDTKTSVSEMANFAVVPMGFLGISALISHVFFFVAGALIFMTRAIKAAHKSEGLAEEIESHAHHSAVITHYFEHEASGQPSVVDAPALHVQPGLTRQSSNVSSTLGSASRAGKSYASKKVHADDHDLQPAQRKASRVLSHVTQELLRNISLVDILHDELAEWDYDVFDLAAKVSNPLVTVGMTCLESISAIKVNHGKMRNYLTCIEDAYNHVPYHNSLHGAAVARSAYSMCKTLGLGAKLRDDIQFALVLAGLIHDVGHPGLTAPFLYKSDDEVSLTYSDDSPLERMHLAVAFKLMRKEENAFLDSDDLRFLKQPIVQAVLGTDMAVHTQQIHRLTTLKHNLKNKSRGSSFTHPELWCFPMSKSFRKDQIEEQQQYEYNQQGLFVMAVFLHAADIASPTMPYNQFRRWNELVQMEFFAQGDKEKELFGTLISDPVGYDRNSSNLKIMRFTKGFIEFVVRPLYTQLDKLSRIDMEENISHNVQLKGCLENIDKNAKELQEAIDKEESKEV